jgi:DNA-binding NtrC family response regulator
MYQIMLVDDEENILKALGRIFRGQTDWEIESYSNAKEALKRAQVTNFDLFLSDYRMPEMNGVEFLREVKNLQPNSMRLILSGHTDLEALLGAINEAEIYRFVTKPWQDYELISTIQQALAFRDVLVENRYLANQVREQQRLLEENKTVLEQFEAKHPDLLEVNWADNGSIILDTK